MTVGQLISELQNYSDDEEVVFKSCNSMYVESIYGISGTREVRSFWGSDRDCLILEADQQIGAV